MPILFRWTGLSVVILVGAAALIKAQSPETIAPAAQRLVNDAVAKAKTEQKAVFVHFGASWCGPCLKLDQFLHAKETEAIVNAHFVILNLTVSERGLKQARNNPGASALMDKWGGGSSIPFYAFLDSGGAVVSKGTGYPGGVEDVKAFLGLVGKSAPRLGSADRAVLGKYLDVRSDGLGSIAGRVSGPEGRPVIGATVTAVGRAFVDGQWRSVASRQTTTDAGGQYVLNDIPAGQYRVLIETPAMESVFFPASTTSRDAAIVPLRRGEGLTSLDVSLTASALVPVSGVVRTSGHEPAPNVTVNLTDVDRPSRTYKTVTAADGSFVFPAVATAQYLLNARRSVATPGEVAEAVFSTLEVSGRERITTSLKLGKGGSASGTVRFDGASPAASDRAAMKVLAYAVAEDAASPSWVTGGQLISRVADDGRFDISGLFGSVVIRLTDVPDGWTLKSIAVNGIDATDVPINVGDNHVSDLSVIVARASELTGTATTNAGIPTTHGTVIVFAADSSRWRYPSRFLRTAPVQRDGSFVVRGLPPGTYLVAAMNAQPRYWDAPEMLESLRQTSTVVELTSGEVKRVVVSLNTVR